MSNEVLLLSTYEDDILDLVQQADKLTTSDLQGAVQAIVRKIYNAKIEDFKDLEITH